MKPRTKKLVTPWMYQNQIFQTPNNKFGFVYLVTCNHPEEKRMYIGRKFFYTNFGKKTKQKESDWKTYKTSSAHVKEAINKYGLEYFTFEIIELFDTRAGVVSAEIELMWTARVLHAKDEQGNRLYWNNAIGNIKFIAKEEVSQETKDKISKSKLGFKHTKETKEKISMARLGMKLPEEWKENIRKASTGRPGKKKLTEQQKEEIKILFANGKTRLEVANMYNVSEKTIWRTLGKKKQYEPLVSHELSEV